MNAKNKVLPKVLHGTIKRHPDGFGFFIPQDVEHPDVFIPSNLMKTAMTSDKVTVIAEKERDGRYRGEIMSITERSQKKIAGAFTLLNEKYGIIKDDGKGWGKDLKIPMEKSLSAKKGELVVAKILEYPDQNDFLGEVIEIIGDIEDALNDIKRVVIAQGLPEEFSKETLAEAKNFSQNPTEEDFKNRKDLRDLDIITIDGATAKDFDDAIYVEMTNQGFHLIVAIADVSYYVKSGTAIDKDAYERGTSAYFPNFVIPMIPEALSNGLCSLNPHLPRLALVADMFFDFTGEMTTSTFYEAVIESKARVTYGEAQEIVDHPDGTSETNKKFAHVKDNILRCADLAKILMAKRFKDGSLDLEVPETELMIDGSGEPVDIIKSERLFAHRLIEEMMLAANVAVAKFLAKKDIPALYRVHEPPDPLKIKMLEKYLHNFGSTANLSGDRLQKKLTKALHEFTNEVQGQIIHILTLRSMSQAKYTMDNCGHFGLGFDFYTHFTSPIRRYPDLIVHRLLKNAISIPGYRVLPEDDVQTAGTWLSACEQRSAKAERQIQAIKKARFMKKLLGQSFEGMISSVTKFGIFVLLREYNTDGLIRLDDLGGEKWEFDEENLKLVAPRSGLSHNIGDRISVTVSSVDIEQGQVNFLIEGTTANVSRQNNRQGNRPQKNNTSYARDKDHKFGKGKDRGKSKFASKDSKKEFGKKSSEQKPVKSNKLQAVQRADNRYGGKPTNPDAIKTYTSKSFAKPADRPERSDRSDRSDHRSEPVVEKRSGPQVIKPKYASLSDYLDQVAKKNPQGKNQQGKSNDGEKSSNKKFQSKEKSGHKFSTNRKDSQKREQTSNDSGGVRKARPSKSGRNTKSR